MKNLQNSDPENSEIKSYLEKSPRKPDRHNLKNCSNISRQLLKMWDSLQICDGILYCRREAENSASSNLVLIAPVEIRQSVFQHLHSHKTAGHLGRDRTILSIKSSFYWPGMSSDVNRWCKQSEMYCRSKPGPGLGKSPLQQRPVSAPLDRIGIDIVGPCPVTENKNEYIIVVCDYFTKWAEAYPVPNHTALTVADKLLSEFISRFCTPRHIHSDQGREFESELFRVLCDRLEMDKTRCTPYRPNSDGLVERFNKTLQQMLKVFVNGKRNDWDDYIPYVLMTYRSTPHESTSCTPNLLMLGREVSMPVYIIFDIPPETREYSCQIEYVEWVQYGLKLAYNLAHKHLKQAAYRQKQQYDQNLKPCKYSVDSFVWRWYPPTAGVKLGLGWTGPYKVIQKCSDITYQIQKTPTSPLIVVHVDHLKPYTGESVPDAWQEISSDNTTHMSQNNMTQMSEPMAMNPNQVPTAASDNDDTHRSPPRTRCGRHVRRPQIYSP